MPIISQVIQIDRKTDRGDVLNVRCVKMDYGPSELVAMLCQQSGFNYKLMSKQNSGSLTNQLCYMRLQDLKSLSAELPLDYICSMAFLNHFRDNSLDPFSTNTPKSDY